MEVLFSIALVWIGFMVLVGPWMALLTFIRQRRDIPQLESNVERLEKSVESLSLRTSRLAEDNRRLQESIRKFEAARPPSEPIFEAPPVVVQPATSAPEPPPPAIVHVEPVPVVPDVAPPLTTAVEPPAVATEPAVPPPPTRPKAAPQEPAAAPDWTGGPPRTPPSPPASRPFAELLSFDWERLVGVKLFSALAAIALTLAAVFFLRFSVEQGWLQPPVRVAMGLVVAIALLVVCELKVARNYPVTANAMDAAAIAILFSTFFAAHALWDLIPAIPTFALLPAIPTFALLGLVTAVAVLLSVRRDSMFIAMLGLLGGFATPMLLSTGADNPIGLFGYLILLNAGLAWVAYTKRWALLTALSLVFTTLYQWAWVMEFMTPQKLPMGVGIFLVFPVLSFVALTLGSKAQDDPDASSTWLFKPTMNASATLPVLLALYWALVPAYGTRLDLLCGFLLCVDVGLFAIAVARGPEWLHLVGGLSTVMVFVTWIGVSYRSSAWPAILWLVALFALFYLAAPFVARWFRRGFKDLGTRAAFAAPLLLFVFPVLARIEPATAAPGLLFGVLFVLLAASAGVAIVEEAGAIHFLGAFFAVAAEAVWSRAHLTEERLLPALAIYAVFALLYLGVPILARRWHKTLRPEGSGAVLLLVSLALLLFLAAGPAAQAALWGISLLLLILNAGLFLEGVTSRNPVISIAGIVLSWVVLAVWWATATITVLLVPALIVVAAFALLTLAGNVWVQKKTGEANDSLAGNSVYLGLIGHLFLFFVASQPALAVPPWPLFGILAVLDLAIGAAALYIRRDELHGAAIVTSAFIVMLWVTVAQRAPWPAVAIWAAGAVAAFGVAWIPLARRVNASGRLTPVAAATVVVLAQVAAIVAAAQPGAPGVTFLAGAHVVFLAVLLGLAWTRQWHVLALVGVVPTAIAVGQWRAVHAGLEFWQESFVLATPIYLLFLAYPILLGRRAGRAIEPYLAAVLASVPFFLIARGSLIQGGFDKVIGVLPVAQAALMSVLLVRLLRLEPPDARSQGRLALVAGAALAFITVAIPLQLDKEWITIGWALEGAALAWLYRKIPHWGLLLASSGLLAAVFVRLALNPAVFVYEPRGALRIWNWYLYTYLVSAASSMLAAWWLSKTDDRLFEAVPRVSKLLPAGATILLFLLLNIEVADYWSTGPTITFNFSATLAQDLTYTLGWALFAVAMLAVALPLRSRPARISSLVLLLVTVFKCFLHDLQRLEELYRVGSFVGLAICLVLVAVAMQKFVLAAPKEIK